MSNEVTNVRELTGMVLQRLEPEYQGIEFDSVAPHEDGALLNLRWSNVCARTLLPAWMVEAQAGPVSEFAVELLVHSVQRAYRKLLAEE